MTRCPSCNEAVAGAGRFCASCGAALDASAMPTEAMAERNPPSSSSGTDEGRFPAGTVLGERYRILGLLGRGGMGEVYRAVDLKLDQTVALKFLPVATARDSRLLERFRGEVRVARQVSHRNVCRVHDIGEADGAAFISMEYVDGEDLGLLLRRIGRLPGDKAIEFSRRLCAGLAAAHEKGVLHRDLKPANVMIDGRGQVLIMDFGLAAAADAIVGGDIRSGTPAYMAPEQKEGREVTVRSDIYSLGLVLAEMFTGQKASQNGASRPERLSTTVKDLDPAVEKLIHRCLDPNPARRPQSALDVARALPGGDPLAEALAAGDTPTPGMVAASEDTGALSVRAAVACLVFVFVGLGAQVFWGSRQSILNLTSMPYSPEVLEQKAREVAAGLGYTAPPVDVARGIFYDGDYYDWAQRSLKLAEYRAQLASGEPPTLIFSHNQSPRYMIPENPSGQVSRTDPARIPGWVEVWLDPQARLRSFRAQPSAESAAAPASSFDSNKLFAAAGLDASRWTPADPQAIPPMAFDARAAWTGTYPSLPQTPLRIEAAAWQGRPVFFEILGPWRRPEGTSLGLTLGVTSGSLPLPLATTAAILAIVALFLAVRNLRTGRGDLRGAARLAAFVLVSLSLNALVYIHHAPVLGELGSLVLIIAVALFVSAFVWAVYMALEPYVRRHWPQALIGWTRALSGSFRDPLVAGHILAGIAAGIGASALVRAGRALAGAPLNSFTGTLETRGVIGNWFGDVAVPPAIALGMFFLFLLLKLLLRRTWLAVVSVIAAFAASLIIGYSADVPIFAVLLTLASTLLVAVSIRFGMLASTFAIWAFGSFARYPLTSNFSAWYAPQGFMEVALILAVSLWTFRHALGGRKVWKSEFLDQ
jgi:serine/threonine-protein kinase